MKWNDGCQAGHFIERDRIWTRYDKRNVHPQCERCNCHKSGRSAWHGEYIKQRYGDILEELVVLSKKTDNRTIVDRKEWLLDIEDDMDRKLKDLTEIYRSK